MAVVTFKIDAANEIKGVEHLAEILRQNLDPKFDITVVKADKGVKKLFTGNTGDYVSIKKNAYHGLVVSMSPVAEGVSYQVIAPYMVVPNFLLNQIVGHEGLLDKAICHVIFGNGKDLYEKFNDVMENVLKAQAVKSGILDTAKAVLCDSGTLHPSGHGSKMVLVFPLASGAARFQRKLFCALCVLLPVYQSFMLAA